MKVHISYEKAIFLAVLTKTEGACQGVLVATPVPEAVLAKQQPWEGSI